MLTMFVKLDIRNFREEGMVTSPVLIREEDEVLSADEFTESAILMR